MGKKYIIELEDKPFHKGNGDFLYRVKGFNSLVFDMTGIGMLTPYTGPDFEQVRKEAYKDGYNADFGKKIHTSYQEGLSDAWETARRIGSDSRYGLEKMGFKFEPRAVEYDPGWYVVQRYSASECIKRIRLATVLEKMREESNG